MSNNKNLIVIIFVVIAFIVAISYWYFFVDTLSLSDIIGKTKNPVANIAITLLDFDTGLIRYDVYNLASKSYYWEKRIVEVYSIKDPDNRNIENEKLLAEMMADPSIKKIAKKLMGFGKDKVIAILKASRDF